LQSAPDHNNNGLKSAELNQRSITPTVGTALVGATPGVQTNHRVMNESWITEHARQVRTRGYTVLRDHFPKADVDAIAVAFQPLYEEHLEEIRNNPNRGPMRHYIALPMERPFYQSSILGNADVIAIVRAILGEHVNMGSYATDTPTKGSEYQDWHNDIGTLFPEEPDLVHPPAVLAVNFSFVDVTPENGPVEVIEGTHNVPVHEVIKKFESGQRSSEHLLLKVGDVLIRDPRCVHRGSPNTTDTPRPVAVISFERHWSNVIFPGHGGSMSRELYDSVSELEQSVLKRFAGVR
jgi:ectoine hydroxylase-related dioxygenase (phytanoyl-CoA dioxygenase family)